MASVNEDCLKYRDCLVDKLKDYPAGTADVGKIEEWLQGLEKKCDPNNTQPCIDEAIAQLERLSTKQLEAEIAAATPSSEDLLLSPELEREIRELLGSLKKRKKSKRKKKSKSSKKSKKSTKTKKSKTKSKKSKRVKRTKKVKRVKRSRTKRVKRSKTKRGKRGKRN